MLSYSHGRIRIGTSPSLLEGIADKQAPKKKDQNVQIHPYPSQFSKYLLVSLIPAHLCLSSLLHLRHPLTSRWCGKGGFADRKCTLDDTLDKWFDNRFPPLSIYHGGRDYLVLAEPLIERMKTKEKDVNVIKVTKLDLSEVSPPSYIAL